MFGRNKVRSSREIEYLPILDENTQNKDIQLLSHMSNRALQLGAIYKKFCSTS